jgi:hypothetical protein
LLLSQQKIMGLPRIGHLLPDDAGGHEKWPRLSQGENMTRNANQQQNRPEPANVRSAIPAFKPVALPALAAAMQAAKPKPRRPKSQELPAILRKEAMD